MNKSNSLIVVTTAVVYSLFLTSGVLYASDTTIKGTGSTNATNSLEVTNSSDTSLLIVRNDGTVGIGDTTPAAALTVGNGDLFQVASTGNVSIVDGVLMDLSAVNASATTEGLKLPQATSTTASTAEGQIAWDTNGDFLTVGTGSTYRTFSGDSGVVCTASIAADAPAALTTTGCDVIEINSDNATSTSRTFCLAAGTAGQELTLFHVAGATNEIELGDGAAGGCSGATGAATAIAGVWPATTNQQNDAMRLVYRGSDSTWVETSRAAN